MKDQGDRSDIEERKGCQSSFEVLTSADEFIGTMQNTQLNEQSLSKGSSGTYLSASQLLGKAVGVSDVGKKPRCLVGSGDV